MPRLVRIIYDASVPAGKFKIGGVRVIEAIDDEAVGRELRTVEVRCRGHAEALRLREIVKAAEGLEMAVHAAEGETVAELTANPPSAAALTAQAIEEGIEQISAPRHADGSPVERASGPTPVSYRGVRSDSPRWDADAFWICSALDCDEASPESGDCPRCGAPLMLAGRWLRMERRRPA